MSNNKKNRNRRRISAYLRLVEQFKNKRIPSEVLDREGNNFNEKVYFTKVNQEIKRLSKILENNGINVNTI